MNFFGIGPLELMVVLVVALIALGPGKTMEAARTIGRVVREARRTFTEVMDAASLSDGDINQPAGPTANPAPNSPVQPPSDPLPAPSHLQEQDAGASEESPDADRRVP
jgi:Sec-independent protein translocase protein TatA